MTKAKILIPLIFLVAVIFAIIYRNLEEGDDEVVEWTEEGQWFKGNTHTHSLWSDGNDFPEMIVDWYQSQGYDFLALSDHNILSRGEKWMSVNDIEKRRKTNDEGTMARYLNRFGTEWVEVRGEVGSEQVRLKALEEFRPLFEKNGDFLLIEGEEISAKYKQYPIHINALNLDELIEPKGGDSVVDTMRNNLRSVKEQSERLGRPILTHLNHPNFHWAITPQQLAEVVEEQFFEVYNGHPGINHLGDKDRPGDEAIWDMANTLRILVHDAPPLFGVATDDSHQYHGGKVSPGRGWVMVWAEELKADQLVEAMQRGEFYASTGVELEQIKYDPSARKLQVNIAQTKGAEYSTKFIGTRRSTPNETGEVFATISGNTAEYQLTGDELYVRAVVESTQPHRNPSYAGQSAQAWTQPVGWRKSK